MIYIAGLALTISGLAVQAYKILISRDRGLSPIFLALMVLGNMAFMMSDFTMGYTAGSIYGILDIIATIMLAILLIAVLTRRKPL